MEIELIIEENYVKNRESTTLEFKKSFARDISTYIKTIFAFANNKGGSIIFGVTDKPRTPVGINSEKVRDFNNWDNARIGELISSFTDTEIDFELDTFKQYGKEFGIFTVKSHLKPVICKKADSKAETREGAIYYRYSAQNKEIKYVDLKRILQEEKDKELKKWQDLFNKAAAFGIDNIGLLSVIDGETNFGNSKFYIDESLLSQIKFIKEGHFVEKQGAPALILKGEIKGLEIAKVIKSKADPNLTHPYEGISSIIKELRNHKEIEDIMNDEDRIYVPASKKYMSIKFILQQINLKERIESKPDLFWSNKRGNDKKYSTEYIDLCKKYLLDGKKLNDLYEWYSNKSSTKSKI
jgi:hypothetical protein